MYIPVAILYSLTVLTVLIIFLVIRSAKQKGKSAPIAYTLVIIVAICSLIFLYQSRESLCSASFYYQYQNKYNELISKDYGGIEPSNEKDKRHLELKVYSLIKKADPMEAFMPDLITILILVPLLGLLIVATAKKKEENNLS